MLAILRARTLAVTAAVATALAGCAPMDKSKAELQPLNTAYDYQLLDHQFQATSLEATDPDGDDPRYELTDGPDGMTVDLGVHVGMLGGTTDMTAANRRSLTSSLNSVFQNYIGGTAMLTASTSPMRSR